MKRGRHTRRRVLARYLHPDEIADRPPQRRARAELERVERILESLPTKADKDGRTA
jgi:hypothetical protein